MSILSQLFRRIICVGMSLGMVLVLGACASKSNGAASASAAVENPLEDDSREWKELEAALLPAPQTADLIYFYVSPTTSYRFSIDAKSIAIGADGVVRYTLVSTSAQGGRNVSYEGIRCATGEKKSYAFGRSDGTWARSRSNQWEVIGEANTNRQHAALMKDGFCPDKIMPKSVKEILDRLAAAAH